MIRRVSNKPVNINSKKRIAIGFMLVAFAMVLLLFRVAWLQIVDADDLTERAIAQQTSDETIQAMLKRFA